MDNSAENKQRGNDRRGISGETWRTSSKREWLE